MSEIKEEEKMEEVFIYSWGDNKSNRFEYPKSITDWDEILSYLKFGDTENCNDDDSYKIEIRSHKDNYNFMLIELWDAYHCLMSFTVEGMREKMECLKELSQIAYNMKSISHMNFLETKEAEGE